MHVRAHELRMHTYLVSTCLVSTVTHITHSPGHHANQSRSRRESGVKHTAPQDQTLARVRTKKSASVPFKSTAIITWSSKNPAWIKLRHKACLKIKLNGSEIVRFGSAKFEIFVRFVSGVFWMVWILILWKNAHANRVIFALRMDRRSPQVLCESL